MAKLDEAQIEVKLDDYPEWKRDGDVITRRYEFDDFEAAIEFVNEVAEEAEDENHHPDILIEYRNVTLRLTTHDAGGLTEKDFRLAALIDALYDQ